MNFTQTPMLQRSYAFGLVAIFISIFMFGCGYPKVSTQSYEYAKAIYGLTNRKDQSRIDLLREQISQAASQSEITQSEVEMLNDILDDAAAGNWKSASQSARSLMMAQVDEQ